MKQNSDIFAPEGAFAQFMNRLDAERAFSGAVLVARGDEVLFERAYGMADETRKLRNNSGTKFNMGSNNKMLTAVAIMQLVEQKKLALCDTVDKYDVAIPATAAKSITIEQLLTHTAGLGDIFTPAYMTDKDKIETVDELLPYIASQPLGFVPGTQYQYSSGGYVVLGAVIEKTSGEGYGSYIRCHITEPLGMADTGFYRKCDAVPNLAHGYVDSLFLPPDKKDDPLYPFYSAHARHRDNDWFLGLVGQPCGGGYSTVRDMLVFSAAIRKHILLPKEATELMISGKVANPYGGKYAYGFADNVLCGHRIVGHSGGAPGIAADFDVLIDDGYTVITFSNRDGGTQKPRAPREEILRLLYG